MSACDDASQPPQATASNAVPPPKLGAARSARYVKLEEVTEWNGNQWGSVAEFNLIDATGSMLNRKEWKASADSATAIDLPANAIDGDPGTLWHTPWEGTAVPPPPHALIVDLGTAVPISGFRYTPRHDKSNNGTFGQYRFYVSSDGFNWGEPVASGNFADMGGPTVEKTVVFAQQTQNHPPVAVLPAAQTTTLGQSVSLKLQASDPDGDPLTFRASGLPPGLAVDARSGEIHGTPIAPGTHAVNVSVSDNKGATAVIAFAWTVRPFELNDETAKPGEARFVKLEQVSEINGKAWASIAEFNVLDASGAALPRKGWIAIADSADASDAPAYAIDGDPKSIWHTEWDGVAPPPPHILIVDMQHPVRIGGFRVLPRQDNSVNGGIGRYRFYVSANGVDWGAPVSEGDLSRPDKPKDEMTVRLK